jgi:hypothetical protein
MKKQFPKILIILSMIFISCNCVFPEGIPEPDILIYGRIMNGLEIIEEGDIEITYTPQSSGKSVTAREVLSKHVGSEPNLIEYSYKMKIPVETVLPGMEASPGVIILSDEDVTYSRIIKVSALEKTAIYNDTVIIGPEGQRGATERRDYNIKEYNLDDIIEVILGNKENTEKIDPNGDQELDVADIILLLN